MAYIHLFLLHGSPKNAGNTERHKWDTATKMITKELGLRLLNIFAVLCLILGFCVDCRLLYFGTFLAAYAEYGTWACVITELKQRTSVK